MNRITASFSRLNMVLAVVLAVCMQAAVPTAQAQEQNTETAEEAGWITVRPGDTLFSISQRFDVSVEDLRAWNELTDSGIRSGMRLRVEPPEETTASSATESTDMTATETAPADSVLADSAPADSVAAAGTVTALGAGMVAVSLGSGETLFSLANRFALTPDSLAALNSGLPTVLEAGMLIIVPQDRVTRQRTVKRGETLFSIAREEGISVDQLRSVNDLSGSSIGVGQRLNIPSSDAPADGAIRLPEAGQFPIRPYPDALSGRTLSGSRVFNADEYLIGHPTLPAGSIVLVTSETGEHAFAEVVESAPARRPVFIEGSRTLLDALSLQPGDVVSLHRVQ